MQKVRKLLCLLLCAAMLMSMSAVCFAANNKYSSWFKTNYDEINQLGLMPASFNGLDLTKGITRGEMCELAVYAFEKATGNDIDLSNENFTGFTDTNDENIVKAHLYGIVNGYEDGSFRPNQLLTRQEFFKLIENFCTAAAFSPTAADGALNGFADANKISSWAKESAQICVSYSYVQGTKLGNGTYLNPKGNTSRQEAMTMFLRCYKTIQWFYDENVKSATVVVDQINLNVTVTSVSKTMYVCQSGSINVRDSWTTGSTKVGELSYNASVTVTGITTTTSDGHQWYRIKYKGITAYVRADLLSDKKDSTVTPGGSTGNGGGTVSGSGTASEIANFAMSFIGYSYVWGGKSPSTGFDCSGLMYYVLTNYGYKMNRVANDQMSQGTYVPAAICRSATLSSSATAITPTTSACTSAAATSSTPLPRLRACVSTRWTNRITRRASSAADASSEYPKQNAAPSDMDGAVRLSFTGLPPRSARGGWRRRRACASPLSG